MFVRLKNVNCECHGPFLKKCSISDSCSHSNTMSDTSNKALTTWRNEGDISGAYTEHSSLKTDNAEKADGCDIPTEANARTTDVIDLETPPIPTETSDACITNSNAHVVPDKPSNCKRHYRGLLLGSMSFQTFFYVGAIFGYGPFQLMLEHHGTFDWKCSSTATHGSVCPAQTSALLRVHFVALTTQAAAPLIGYMVDRYGNLLLVRYMMGNLLFGLVVMIAIAASPSSSAEVVDRFWYVGFTLLAQSTFAGAILSVQTGLYFLGRMRHRVITILNALFDAGGVTYFMLYYLGRGIWPNKDPLVPVLSLYLGFGALLSAVLYFAWTVAIPETQGKETQVSLTLPPDTEPGVEVDDSEAGSREDVGGLEVGTNRSLADTVPHGCRISNSDSVHDEGPIPGTDPPIVDSSREQRNPDREFISDGTAREQLLSLPFILLLAFFSIHTSANQYNLTTQRDFLAYMGDDDYDNKYLSIFTFLLPVSVAGIPLVDIVIHHFGFHSALQCINALALGYNLVKLCTTNLNVQILGFVVFSFYRCFLFSVSFATVAALVGPTVTGKASGFMFLGSGLTSLVNIPLSNFAVEQQKGDFFVANLIYTLSIIPCVLVSVPLGRAVDQEGKNR
jgi:hypothetical protein